MTTAVKTETEKKVKLPWNTRGDCLYPASQWTDEQNEYRQNQKEWQKNGNFQKGDKVVVMQKWESGQGGSVDCEWVDGCEVLIGKTVTIVCPKYHAAGYGNCYLGVIVSMDTDKGEPFLASCPFYVLAKVDA